MVIYSQLNYYQNKSLGFNKEQVIIIEDSYTLGEKIETFKNELKDEASIYHVTATGFLPVHNGFRSDSPLQPKASKKAENSVSMQLWRVDQDYLPTMQIELIKGRNFDPSYSSDSSAIIINEAAAKKFDFENPIGEKIKLLGNFSVYGLNEFTIIGVIRNFHYENFRMDISPLGLMNLPSSFNIAIRYDKDQTKEVLALIDKKWAEFNPGYPLSYSFLDEKFNKHYQSEEKLGTLFSAFAFFSILIACLGLFGLASYSMDQRKKELGVRKVLGASTLMIIRQQLGIYSKLLVISIAIGLPLGGFLMNKWLEDFIYRTSVSYEMYLIPALLVFMLSWLVVSIISFRAARISPVIHLNRD
jgi:putative ABC transport system permease protein